MQHQRYVATLLPLPLSSGKFPHYRGSFCGFSICAVTLLESTNGLAVCCCPKRKGHNAAVTKRTGKIRLDLACDFNFVIPAAGNLIANIARQNHATRRSIVSGVIAMDQESIASASVMTNQCQRHHARSVGACIVHRTDRILSARNWPNVAGIFEVRVIPAVPGSGVAGRNDTSDVHQLPVVCKSRPSSRPLSF